MELAEIGWTIAQFAVAFPLAYVGSRIVSEIRWRIEEYSELLARDRQRTQREWMERFAYNEESDEEEEKEEDDKKEKKDKKDKKEKKEAKDAYKASTSQ